MSLNQRLQRISDHLHRNRHQITTVSDAEIQAMWEERLPLLSDVDLDRLELIYAKIVEADGHCAQERYWLHEVLDEPCLTAAERDELVAIFLTMNIDLVAMAAAGVPQ